jgi:hypothetical protein
MEIAPLGADPERAQEARENVLEAKRLLARVRKENLRPLREASLARDEAFWRRRAEPFCRAAERPPFVSLFAAMRQAAGRPGGEYESLRAEFMARMHRVLWRQNDFVSEIFAFFASDPPWKFSDAAEHARLISLGRRQEAAGDMNGLRETILGLIGIRVGHGADVTGFDPSNIISGERPVRAAETSVPEGRRRARGKRERGSGKEGGR